MRDKNTIETEKSRKTRQKIIDTYFQLIETKDFDKITVRAIVETAGISRGAFYLYFTDIYEIITETEDMLLGSMPAFSRCHIPAGSGERAIYKLAEDTNSLWEREWLEHYQKYSFYYNALLGSHGDSGFYFKVVKFLRSSLNVQMNSSQMPDDEVRQHFLEFLPDLFLSLARQWTSDNKLADLSLDMITQILSTIKIGSQYRYHSGN
ncbi:MAG: TetR/AcrR family transcriptional regulator [Lachnospiraceae bacterium]|nr:TetR/AcrR family transcriptional regulator [Lachnospiraceae bacterium]